MQLNIPPEKKDRIIAAMKGIYPIPMIPDPFWTGDPNEVPMIPEFSDAAWAREAIIRLIKRDVRRWEARLAMTAAGDAVVIDDDIVS